MSLVALLLDPRVTSHGSRVTDVLCDTARAAPVTSLTQSRKVTKRKMPKFGAIPIVPASLATQSMVSGAYCRRGGCPTHEDRSAATREHNFGEADCKNCEELLEAILNDMKRQKCYS